MVEVAAAVGAAEGAAWLQAAVRTFDGVDEAEQTTLSQFGCARYQLLQKLAESLVEGGQPGAAAEAMEEAAEAAMEAGKAKISMRLASKAEALREEMGEEEEAG